MNFLVDAQLPLSLSDYLLSHGHSSIHTIELLESNRTKDAYLIQLTVKENRILITKDQDFLDYFLIHKLPKKLILVKTGNISNKELIGIFDKHFTTIMESIRLYSLIEITKTEIAILQ